MNGWTEWKGVKERFGTTTANTELPDLFLIWGGFYSMRGF